MASIPAPARSPDERLCVGVVAGPRGLRGEVRVRSYTEVPEDIAAYRPLTDESGEREFRLRVVGHHKDQLIVRIDGIDDRSAAEALGKPGLFVPRSALPAPAEEEYYHADLVGLRAVGEQGEAFGAVRAVHDFGAGTVLEIRQTDGRDVMVPFSRAVVPDVDIAGGRLVVVPPPGLLDGVDDDAEAEL